MAKIPWHFFKIPWQFPDLEKILFFPDFSLTRGNPALNIVNTPLSFQQKQSFLWNFHISDLYGRSRI